jgi:superfamily II DNA/RNA helicase
MATELSESERIKSVEAFKALGVHAQLAEAAASLGWKSPSPIQEQAVPLLLQGGTMALSAMMLITAVF